MTKSEANKLLTMGNHKLGGKIASFSLPASQGVCGRICTGCYALKAQKIYPAVLPSREKKYFASQQTTFQSRVVESIKKLQPDYIRIHDSGEFYSQEYIEKWAEIAKHSPSFIFYTYTKRLGDFNFRKLKQQPNVVIIDSLHGGSINFGKKEKRPKDMFLCPDHKGSVERTVQPKDPICGTLCTYCMTKSAEDTGVYFVQH